MVYKQIENSSKKELDNVFLDKIANEYGISVILAKILFLRGFDSKEKLKDFFEPSLSQLSDPFLFKDMQAVVDKINKAAEEKKRIVVFGDYDVDGICATYILLSHLRGMGVFAKGYVPHRIADGYGMTQKTILDAKAKYNPDLIITVDCGISCKNEVEFAKSLGIDVIITDHHMPPDCLPDAPTINPKCKGSGYNFDSLCGAGVALKVVQALGGMQAVQKYLPACALATIADIVPLVAENRAIVSLGLKKAKTYLPIGIKKLIEMSEIKNLDAQSVSFRLAPKINAPGRLGDSNTVIKLFLEKDEEKATKLAMRVIELNTKRQEIGTKILQDCEEQLKDIDLLQEKCIVLKKDDWEAGLLGIAASKISGETNRPTFLFALHDGMLKGSVRSICGINIVDIMSAPNVKKHLANFGGHEMAGGLSLLPQDYDNFKKAVTLEVAKVEPVTFEQQLFYDCAVDFKQLNLQLAKDIKKLEPCGLGNNTPVFLTTLKDTSYNHSKNNREHLLINTPHSKTKILVFNGLKFCDLLDMQGEKLALVELFVDEYNNKQSSKVIVKDLNSSCLAPKQEVEDGANFYATKTINKKMDTDRKIFTIVYNIIKKHQKHVAVSLYNWYSQIKKNDHELSQVSYCQFVFCVLVFEELGFLSVTQQKYHVKININSKSKKQDLSQSRLYQANVSE